MSRTFPKQSGHRQIILSYTDVRFAPIPHTHLACVFRICVRDLQTLTVIYAPTDHVCMEKITQKPPK